MHQGPIVMATLLVRRRTVLQRGGIVLADQVITQRAVASCSIWGRADPPSGWSQRVA